MLLQVDVAYLGGQADSDLLIIVQREDLVAEKNTGAVLKAAGGKILTFYLLKLSPLFI